MRKTRKMKKIGLAISMAMSFGVANVAFADADGDSLVYLPANAASLPDEANVADVWFVKDNTALAYSITLVRFGDDAAVCDAATISAALDESDDSASVLESSLVMANTLSCDDESQLTKTGGDATLAAVATPVKLCNWQSNMLAPGSYGLAINPIHVGDGEASAPETLDVATFCDDDNDAHLDNDPSYDAAEDAGAQLFTVDEPTTDSGITQAPDAPVLTGPNPVAPDTVHEWDATSEFEFDDVSPDEGQATWYKIYIEAPDGSRVTVNGDNWFKLLVDPQLTCQATEATATGQKRSCTIDLTENEVTGDLDDSTLQPGEEYTYWIRGYNGDSGGATGPWSAAGKFKHETQDE